MKVVAFNGSPRRDGNTAAAIRLVLAELEKRGIETESVQVGGVPIRGCTSCFSCERTGSGLCAVTLDPMNEWIGKMRAADGILLASPVYFYDVTSEMTALIDRAGFVARGGDRMLKRKVGAALTVLRRVGAVHALDTMNHFFQTMQMFIVGGSNNAMADIGGNIADDSEGVRNMQLLGENMALLLQMRDAWLR